MPRVRLGAARSRSGGQALVEFALILIPLMLILMGILQFGLLLSSQLGLINSTREGTRYGATFSTDGSTSSTTATNVLCYTLGFTSSARGTCPLGGTTPTGTLARAMPAYNRNNVCITGDSGCAGDFSSVDYCYYADPTTSPQTYSLRLNVKVVYRHPLIAPLISTIVDGIDGVTDNALRASSVEQFRVEGPALTAIPTGASVSGPCS